MVYAHRKVTQLIDVAYLAGGCMVPVARMPEGRGLASHEASLWTFWFPPLA